MKSFIPLAFLLWTLASQNPQPSETSPNNSSSRTSTPETGITKEQAAKIIQELQMIRMLMERELEARAKSPAGAALGAVGMEGTSPEKTISDLGEHVLGSNKAPITLVEFADLQCPFCVQFHKDVFPTLQRKYIDTGKVRFAVFDFPLPSHVYAVPAATLAHCAGAQGKYWLVHDALMGANQVATPDTLRRVANEAQLDQGQLDKCVKNSETSSEINREQQLGRDLGVFGTPTFLLGRNYNGKVSGHIIEGAPSVESLEAKIEELLKQEANVAH